MKLCFPVEQNLGLQSEVYGHFGSAPIFLIIDTETKTVAEEINRDLHHAHGRCSPLAALCGRHIDAVITGGIGGGALNGLTSAGVKVYRADGTTIEDNLDRYLTSGLPLITEGHCGGHAHSGGCSHG